MQPGSKKLTEDVAPLGIFAMFPIVNAFSSRSSASIPSQACAVVLWVMATQDLKTSRLTGPTISLGNSVQYFMILTAILL